MDNAERMLHRQSGVKKRGVDGYAVSPCQPMVAGSTTQPPEGEKNRRGERGRDPSERGKSDE